MVKKEGKKAMMYLKRKILKERKKGNLLREMKERRNRK